MFSNLKNKTKLSRIFKKNIQNSVRFVENVVEVCYFFETNKEFCALKKKHGTRHCLFKIKQNCVRMKGSSALFLKNNYNSVRFFENESRVCKLFEKHTGFYAICSAIRRSSVEFLKNTRNPVRFFENKAKVCQF